jgi:hypothetical protein
MQIRTERLLIEDEGAVFIGDDAAITVGEDAVVDLTDAFVELPQMTTASIPTAAASNKGYLIYDTTLNKLKFSTGSAWETITSS